MNLHEPVRELLKQSLDSFGSIVMKAHSIAGHHRVASAQDMRAFARSQGYQVRQSPSLPATHPGYSATLGGVSYIEIKRGLLPESEIYTLAHEIGHHQMGHTGDDCVLSFAQREVEANVFALMLLGRLVPELLDDVLGVNPDGRVTSCLVVFSAVALAVAALVSWLLQELVVGGFERRFQSRGPEALDLHPS